jgi:two-component system, NtrC family, nitrogen regulation sensor histidine kinase NtrY
VTRKRLPGASVTGLLSLILLYLLLIILVLVFAGQVLTDLSFGGTTATTVILIIAVLFPVLLLGLIVYNLVGLFRDRALARPGARLKSRLLTFFLVIVLLASIPQGILSIGFIQTATRAWFSEDTGRAIRDGQSIALAFFSELERDLAAFAESPYARSLLEGVDRQPARVWERVNGVNPMLDSFQVFGPEFQEVYAGGAAALHLSPLHAAAAREGQVARESIAGVSFLRVRLSYLADTRPRAIGETTLPAAYTIIVAARLPTGFDEAASRLTESLAFFVQLDRFQENFVTAIRLFYAFFSFPLILVSLLVSFLLSEEIMRPIVSLEDATRRVAEGDFSTRILTRRSDELSMLVNSFNRMVGELERTREKIIQTEKIAAWQDIAQRLAHEVKNPLTPIRLAAERALRKYQTGSDDFGAVLETSVRSIVGEVDNLSALLSEFREFSRLPAPRMEEFDLHAVIADVVATYASGPSARVSMDGVPEGLKIVADPGQVRQLVSNLVKNALEAVDGAGQVRLHVDPVTKGDAVFCRIRIEDDGPGIRPDQQTRIFDPYVTTKPKGTGLGLAIVQRIVFDHHGQIWFESQPGVGTTFYVDLPASLRAIRRKGVP